MPAPDDPHTAAPAEFPDDMQTIAEAKPDAAWMISSKAGRAAHGPFCPKPVATA